MSLPRNHVLKALSAEDFALLLPSMHQVQLDLKAQLEVPYQPIEHVYFPEAGIASVVATMTGGRQSEVGIIGFDGMTGVAVILGQDSSPNETYIQVAGNGWCLPVENLQSEVAKSQSLRASLLAYAHAFLVQSSRTALVNGHSKIEERLARWLLMVHDRTEGNKIHLTHEFLATMLGSRRPGVTTALANAGISGAGSRQARRDHDRRPCRNDKAHTRCLWRRGATSLRLMHVAQKHALGPDPGPDPRVCSGFAITTCIKTTS
ncbi:Crp/Fnr family transcriptional regulator [Mesorhizobium sp.]|uniref:Crp/Fnr family transcriptional regulator n=1 Tax=Mesorhizobium sp. TaxID=1871066 RepID=UPI00257FBABD|nr:Crp/Fnr family transcriptional regulator [Mesorhizobium sp.]